MQYNDLLKTAIILFLFTFLSVIYNNYRINNAIEYYNSENSIIEGEINSVNTNNDKIIEALKKIVKKQNKIMLNKIYNENNIIPESELSEHDKESRKKFKDLESRYLKKALEEYEVIKNN